MKLTTRGRYTLQALLDVVNNAHGRPMKLQEVADRQKLSIYYLEQLFRLLRIAGIVSSSRGPGGGYSLVGTPETITVRQILLALGESTSFIPDEEVVSDTAEAKAVVDYLQRYERVATKLLDMTLKELSDANS